MLVYKWLSFSEMLLRMLVASDLAICLVFLFYVDTVGV